jgi:exosome complex RNA-binding protein Rrp42 (RNase PH superfamily)
LKVKNSLIIFLVFGIIITVSIEFSRRMELLSDEGFRFDGRRAAEFRKIQGRLGVFDHADGSAILQQVNL